jgi:uncharacterized protein (TIGR02246 family)
MNAIRFPMVLLVVLLGACSQAPPPSFTQAQRDSLALEVREVIAEITEAMNSHDPERFLSFFRESGEFVYVGCTDAMFGFGDFSVRVTPYYRNSTDVIFQQEVLTVQVLSPTTAVVTLRGSSSEAPAVFGTEVMVKDVDGRWLIAHEHQSWPGCPEPSPPHPTGSLEDPGETS